MKFIVKWLSKHKEQPQQKAVIKIRSTVYPDKQVDINDWYKHVHSYKKINR